MSFDNPRRRLKLTTRITVFHIVLFSMLSIVAMLLITFITVGYLDRRIHSEFTDVVTHLSEIADQQSESLSRYSPEDRFVYLLNAIRAKGVYDSSKYSVLLVDAAGRSLFDDPRTKSSVYALTQKASKQLREPNEQISFQFTDHMDQEKNLGRIRMQVENTATQQRAPIDFDFYYMDASSGVPTIHKSYLLNTRTYYSVRVLPLASEPRIYIIFVYFAKSESDFVLILNSALFFAGAVGVGLLLTFGTVFARTSLQPLKDLSAIVGTINFEEYNDRIPRPNVDDEVTHLVDSLNRMLANLQDAYDDQKRFTSDVSHELRIPLTIIIGYLDLVRRYRAEDPALLEEALGAIESEANHMKSLTDSLLLLARLENKKLRPTYAEMDIDPWMERVLSDARLLYPDRFFSYRGPGSLSAAGASIDDDAHAAVDAAVDTEPYSLGRDEAQTQPRIYSDENLLTQLLRCFIENSVKYSEPNTAIDLSARLDGRQIELRVTDHGYGIPEDRIAQLTRRFYRVDQDRSRESGGTGLGLAIADGIVKALRGTMAIESVLGEGTSITVRIPF
ncbi:MAG: HAMP domain-containing sensor histidine kinase [Bacillota bacterium]|nr:HAMP domain-containing sensor histidine kinase [Bacillota bacterium]